MEEDKKDASPASASGRKTIVWLYNPATWSLIYPLMQQVVSEHNVIPGTSPDQGYTVCRTHKDIDCIVTPGLGWIEVITNLRKLKPWTPIVVFEAADEKTRLHYMRCGASFQCDHIDQLMPFVSASKKDAQLPPIYSPTITHQARPTARIVWPRTGDRVVSSFVNIGYTIGEKLGEGSFGFVYRCKDDFGQHFVIKILKPFKPKDETEADWEKESRFLLSLRHPNIIQLYDLFEYNNLYYMVIEEADGSLKNLIEQKGPMSEHDVVKIAGQLLSGLHHIHSRGVIHRDLQADNILFKYLPSTKGAPKIQAKISDFGISKFQPQSVSSDEGLRAYTNVGRAYDVSPELLTQGYTTQQSDIYQLGLILYYLYQGRPALGPQDGKSADAIVNGVARVRAESIGTPLGHVIAKMLRRRAEWRFQNTLEVWMELYSAVLVQQQGKTPLSRTPLGGAKSPLRTSEENIAHQGNEGRPPLSLSGEHRQPSWDIVPPQSPQSERGFFMTQQAPPQAHILQPAWDAPAPPQQQPFPQHWEPIGSPMVFTPVASPAPVGFPGPTTDL